MTSFSTPDLSDAAPEARAIEFYNVLSNFDFMSYHILEEHVVMSRDRELLRQFRNRVWLPDVASAKAEPVRSSLGTRLGDAGVRLGAALAARLALEEV